MLRLREVVLDRLKCLATLAHRLQLRIGDRLRIKSRRSVVAISILALSCGGCSNSDFVYLNQGIGTALSASDLETQSSLLNQYVDLLCQQAGLVPEGILVPCNDAFFSPAQWMIFVQAGMNDIDRRCDAYLQWLDDKRRWQHPILQEISDVRTATELIMAASGVGVAPIAIVGAAFGLATSTFTNLSSRLVLEVNQSTVQSVVLTSQNKYRFTLINGDPLTVPPTPPTVIVSRPSAIYVLRSYLRLCLPFTIETQINTTVTAVDRGDTEATYRKPLITPAAAGVPFTARSVIVRPSREAPPAATSPLIKYIEGGSSTQGDATYIKNVLRKLCVPPGQLDSYNAYTIARIIAYQQYMTGNVDPTKPPAGLLSPHDLTTLSSEPQYCKTDLFQNYFEEKEYPETQYPGGIVNEDVVGLLNKALEADQKLRTDGTATQKEVRQKIAVVRRKLGTKVLQNDQLSEQWTIDLRLVLFALR